MQDKMQDKIYYKLTDSEEKYGDTFYHNGLNITNDDKGFIFLKIENVFECLYIGARYLRIVRIEKDYPVKTYGCKHYSNTIYLADKYDMADPITIMYIIKKGGDVNSRDGYLLKWACHEGYFDVVKYIYQISTITSDILSSCLEKAVSCDHIDIIKFLISNGADLTKYDNRDYHNPIICSFSHGYIETGKYLLLESNNINEIFDFDNRKMIPVLEDPEYLKKMIDKGLTPDKYDKIFTCCVLNGYIETIKYLVSIEAKFSYSNQAVIICCGNGDLKMLMYLASIGFDIQLNMEKAFKSAIINNRYNIIEYLINFVNLDLDYSQYLEIASKYSELNIIEFIHDTGVKSDRYQDIIDYCLINVCQRNNIELAEYILSLGANINVNNGIILVDAAKNGHENMVKYLLQNGAQLYDNEIINYCFDNNLVIAKYLAREIPIMDLHKIIIGKN
ncbi:ankyrin repeat protein [Megavirus baoshan]|uniref:Ankyrin repeat protein n=1 Tax=Megavirus baoshan TaxID=2496520 RepID=A0A3S8UY38_9VIRU|nr:ankyrin repeat protein [Megavirus baoshan]AZL89627.1 ankyrin repeat protein [Megavirus baoshan]